MKKLTLILALLLVLSVLFTACGKKDAGEDWAVIGTPAEPGGTPTEVFKFYELPEVYTPEQALADGCLVLQWDEGSTTPRVRGIDYWEHFLKVSRAKEKISLRIVYFNASHHWFSDLYYSHDQYSLYTRDTYSENQIGPFKYFTEISGKDLYSEEDVYCFILTDDAALSSNEVLSLQHICDIEAERNIAYTIVDFTTYLKK